MKASVKVREGQRPLVRGKVPVQVGGLPFYSGISVGDEKELALHLGTNMESGPSCSLSYRPNDPQSPLAMLLKTGFGLWGSPHAAPFTIAAEFNIARRDNVSFTLRLKPQVGSFSFRKHFLSTSGNFGGRELRSSDRQVQEEVEVDSTSRPSGAPPTQGDGLAYENDYDCGLSPLGLGQVKVIEKKCYDPGSPVSNGDVHHVGDGSGELEMLDDGAGVMDAPDGDRATAATDGGAVVREDLSKARRSRLLQSWSGNAHRSWGLTVHSAIPLGRQAMGRVKWGMQMPSNEGSGNFFGHKLPVLVLDKISIRSVEKAQRSSFPPDSGPLSYRMRYFENPVDDGSQLGLIASVCCSMRNQLQSLQSDNASMKKIIEDMKAEMGGRSSGGLGEKRLSPKPAKLEQDSIRSQLFEELQKKTSSRASPKGFINENRGVSSGQNQESIFDLPSEGLLDDKKVVDLGAKARAK